MARVDYMLTNGTTHLFIHRRVTLWSHTKTYSTLAFRAVAKYK